VQTDNSTNFVTGGIGVLLAILGWIWMRLIGQQDGHERRIRALEQDRVTKGDITAVYERIKDLSDQSSKQALAILRALGRHNAL
jgi:hypothetical protein